MAKARAKAKKTKPVKLRTKPKPKIKGYDILAVQQYTVIGPGEAFPLFVDCPKGKVILGGGAESQHLPGDSPYALKGSWPIKTGTGQRRWEAVWTNTSDRVPVTPASFTFYAIVADA